MIIHHSSLYEPLAFKLSEIVFEHSKRLNSFCGISVSDTEHATNIREQRGLHVSSCLFNMLWMGVFKAGIDHPERYPTVMKLLDKSATFGRDTKNRTRAHQETISHGDVYHVYREMISELIGRGIDAHHADFLSAASIDVLADAFEHSDLVSDIVNDERIIMGMNLSSTSVKKIAVDISFHDASTPSKTLLDESTRVVKNYYGDTAHVLTYAEIPDTSYDHLRFLLLGRHAILPEPTEYFWESCQDYDVQVSIKNNQNISGVCRFLHSLGKNLTSLKLFDERDDVKVDVTSMDDLCIGNPYVNESGTLDIPELDGPDGNMTLTVHMKFLPSFMNYLKLTEVKHDVKICKLLDANVVERIRTYYDK